MTASGFQTPSCDGVTDHNMPSHTETRFSPHSPAQLYAMVMDVEKYPEFLPWCKAARVMDRQTCHSEQREESRDPSLPLRMTESFVGELVISFNHLTESYRSKVVGIPPSPQSSLRSLGEGKSPIPEIQVTLLSGPFKHLSNHWRFEPTEGGTTIHFALDFAFRSKLLERLMGGLFAKAIEKMTSAFMHRADVLYGS